MEIESEKEREGLARVLLVVASAVLTTLLFPPFRLWFLAPVACWPLLSALRAASIREATWLGLLFGIILYAAVLSWLYSIFGHAAFALWFMLASFTALFGGLYAWIARRWSSVWLAPLLWTGIEFFRSEWFWMSFSWATPGVGLGPMFLSPLVGVYGISFACILSSSLLASKTWRNRITGNVLAFLLVFGSAMVRLKNDPTPEDPVSILAIQNEGVSIDYYLSQSRKSVSHPYLILWPEYAIGYDIRRSPEEWQRLLQLAAERDCVITVGTQTVIDDETYYNTALTLDQGGALGEHYKIHTVHLFNDGVAGETARAIQTSIGKIGTPICFDCDHSFVIRNMTADGAEFFAVPSMDPADWPERQHWQHAELFRHRAAENSRWMAVASSSGITQLIAPNGKRVSALPAMEPGELRGKLGRSGRRTIFTRVGWLFGPACLCAAVLLVLARGFRWKSREEAAMAGAGESESD